MHKLLLFLSIVSILLISFSACEKTGNETDGFRIDENQTNWKKYIYTERSINTSIDQNTYGAYEVLAFNHYQNRSVVIFKRYLTSTQTGIASSTNGGTTWTVDAILNYTYDFIDFVNDSIGFAIGTSASGDHFFTTNDGGLNWQANNLSLAGAYPYAVSFVDENLMYAINQNGFYRSVNGGQNWLGMPYSMNYDEIFSFNDSIAYAIEANALYRTTDSASSWQGIYTASANITQVFQKTDSIIFLGLKGGIIQRSTDAGISFNTVSDYIYSLNNSEEVLFTDIGFYNNNIGFASLRSDLAIEFPQDEIGIGALLKTDDGGENWYLNYRTQMIKLNGLFLLDATHCFAYGRQEADHVFRQAYILKTISLGD